ncbi:MAG: preprotein translocase subunit SecE [bacterium]|nr:preprotein translocase subunit SecE [bacterium]
MATANTTKSSANVHQKSIYITFIVVGMLAWFPVSSLMYTVFDWISAWVPNPKLFHVIEVSNLLAIGISVLIVLGMIRSENIYNFTNEVFIELGKVSWPIKQGTGISNWEKFRDLRESTLVVLFSIVVMSAVITLMDFIFGFFVKIIF